MAADPNPTAALKKEILGEERIAVKNKTKIGASVYKSSANSTYKRTRGTYYTISAVAYMYLHRNLEHGEYLLRCKEAKIDAVSYIDKERILSDLRRPPLISRIKSRIPTRTGKMDIESLLRRYREVSEEGGRGLYYVIAPRSTAAASVLPLLLDAEKARHRPDNEIEYEGKRYKVTDTPTEISSFRNVAAVFIDGTPWQFREWPKEEIAEALKHIPVFYLHLEDQNVPIPKLPERVSILKADAQSDVSTRLAASAFWSIMGHRV